MSIAVMGATGRVGGQIARRLLEAGMQVRALGRSGDKLAALARAGADVRAGDAGDAAFLTEAFRGADAVFTLMPYDPRSADYYAEQRERGEAIVTALGASGVRFVVALSSLGADQPSGTGVVVSLHDQEARLRTLAGVNVVLLRPGSFFENFHEMLDLIREQGVTAEAVEPERPVPMIATRDVAAVAAGALAARDWTGHVVRELLGPRDLTYAEAARIIGTHIGRPDLSYVQLPYDELVGALVAAGVSDNVATLTVGLSRGINEGRVRSLEGRRPDNTTPTRFEDFAGELARAYHAR